MALSDISIRNAKPASAQFKLFDTGGLFVIVRPSGGKLWRVKYRLNGKEQQLSLGQYPDVSLKDARAGRDDARKLLAAGKSPSVEKRRAAISAAISAGNSFRLIADEVIARSEHEGRAAATMAKARWCLRLINSSFGDRPITEIEPAELLALVQKSERAGHHEKARRILAFSSTVFRHAIVTARARSNPAADLRGALVAPKVRHHAAILEPVALGGLLRAIDGFDGQPATRLALRLAPHVYVRPGELRQAEWTEIDLIEKVWRLPKHKMKMGREHVVPLSAQSVAVLKEAKLLTGSGRYVFPSIRSSRRPMSENTINAALRRMGYSQDEMTGHGFRSAASTLLNESGRFSTDAIERALAHQDTDHVRAAYHRGVHWDERVTMAQWWSDYLDNLKSGATVIPMRYAGKATMAANG
jgi:integrase